MDKSPLPKAMALKHLQLARRTARFAALSLLVAALAGCQGLSGTQPFTQVRFIDASPDAPALDIYQNAAVGLYNVGFGTVSSYMAVAPGTYIHAVYSAGTQQQLASVRGALASGGQYTVLAGNVAASLHITLLKDQTTPAPSGQVALRFLDQATRIGAVDIYLLPAGGSLSGVAPIAAGVTLGGNTGYINVPAGTYSVVVLASGVTLSAVPGYTGSQAAYSPGSAHTIVLIDQPSGQAPAIQAISAADYDPAPAQ